MPSPLSAAASLALMALVALLSVSTISPAVVDATALTYNVAAHERACFYAWNDIPKKKIAFYFAVRTSSSSSTSHFIESYQFKGQQLGLI